MTPPDRPIGAWDGSCGFRMMPSDEFATGPSSATTTSMAGGVGWLLDYTWTHPQDGAQSGALLIGSPAEDGTISAGWVDSWHQQPELRVLTGPVTDNRITVSMDYQGWGWTIEIVHGADQIRMRMNNVVPEGIDGAAPGPYVVMDATWRAR